MADQTIDRLIYALDGDLSALKAKYAEAEAGAQRTGKKISDNIGKPLQDAAGKAAQSANTLKKSLDDAAKGGENLGKGAEVGRREVFRLGKELATGDIRGAPMTLLKIAAGLGGVSGAAALAGIAVLAIPAAFVAAGISAENALARVRKELMLTNNAAGVTADSVLSTARNLGGSGGITGLSTRGAMDIGSIMLSRGNVAGQQLPGAIGAASRYADARGLKTDEGAKEFEALLSDPAKATAELNAQFKLLDVATTRQIQDLALSGNQALAQQRIIDAVNTRFGHLEDASWSLARTFDGAGKFISNLWFKTGTAFTGNDKTTQEKLDAARGSLAYWQASQKQGVGSASYYVQKRQQEISSLEAQMKRDTESAKKGGAAALTNSAIGTGMADASKETGAFAERLRALQQELNRDAWAADQAAKSHSQFAGTLETQRASVATALANQRDPAQEAQERARQDAVLARMSPGARERQAALFQAQNSRQKALQNPATVPYAEGIYNADIQGSMAGISGKRAWSLRDAQEQAMSAMRVAKALDTSAAAGAREKVTSEARQAVIKGLVDDEKAYAAALRLRAFAESSAASAENINRLKIANDNQLGIIRTGGAPAAMMMAKAHAEALSSTQGERDSAITSGQQATAAAHLRDTEAQIVKQQELDRSVRALTTDYDLNTQAEMIGSESALRAVGQAGDELRRSLVAQQTYNELVKEGWDIGSQALQDEYHKRVALNLAISDGNDDLKTQTQLASDSARAVTGPLGGYLKKGGSLRQVGSNVLGGLGDAMVNNTIIKPLNDSLEGAFGSLFGGGAKPDGSSTKPFYVTQAGGVAGVSGGLSSLLGGSGGGGSGGGILGAIASFAGFFAGGGDIQPGQWGITGEKGPEPVFGGRTGKTIFPNGFAGAPSVPSSGSQQTIIQHTTPLHFSVDVSGANGDKAIHEIVSQAIGTAVPAALESYDNNLDRTVRGKLVSANRRAMR